jgi:Flp pilus assembly protein TadB
MKDLQLKEIARERAEAYAPAPTDSRLLYGVIAASLLIIAAIAVAAFYGLDLSRHLGTVSVLAMVAFAAGLIFRRLQSRRHRRAHRAEYESVAESP